MCTCTWVQVLRMPLFQLPQLITQLVNARVAMTRLQEFLSAPQQPPARFLPPAEPGGRCLLLLQHLCATCQEAHDQMDSAMSLLTCADGSRRGEARRRTVLRIMF